MAMNNINERNQMDPKREINTSNKEKLDSTISRLPAIKKDFSYDREKNV